MTRLIDADKLKELMIEVLEHIKENPKMDGQERHIIAGIHMLGEMIDDAPTVDAVPVRHGRWIFIRDEGDGSGNSLYSCSECGQGDIQSPVVTVPYCWHCGARMEAKKCD